MDAYLKPPRVVHQPGVEYADGGRCFQGIPTIERAANGRLWAAWYGGGEWEGRDNYLMLAGSADDGERWTAPTLVVVTDPADAVRPYDPCLWHDPAGRLWLFFTQGNAPVTEQGEEVLQKSVWVMRTDDSDVEAPVWTSPQRLMPGHVLNKPIVTADGDWLLCVAYWYAEGSAAVFASTDQGAHWTLRGRAHIADRKERGFDEPMLVERRDGSLWMLVRTKYGIGESVSTDRGRTWSDIKPNGIGHVSTRFFISRLSSGSLLLVKHGASIAEAPDGRSRLSAFVSDDDGRRWSAGLMLDARDQVSYPDGVEAPDGTLYLIHDFERKRAKEILLSRITEADIRAGSPQTARSRLGLRVNQAAGINPTADIPGNPCRIGHQKGSERAP